MSERSTSSSFSKTRNPNKSQNYNSQMSMARKSSLLKQTLIFSAFFILLIYAFFNTFLNPTTTPAPSLFAEHLSRGSFEAFTEKVMENSPKKVKVFMYDLPKKFTTGIIEHHALARGSNDVSKATYPGHQHMGEWHMFKDLNRPEEERAGSPVTKVDDPEEADLFYVPVFSSLSLIVNPVRPGGPASGSGLEYSDENMQEELMEWLEQQEYWKRSNGRDHVIVAGDPNALYRVIDRVKNAVLLVSDFGRVRPDQGSLVKDVIVPYAHRINTYNGNISVANRKTLLFFMGNRYRKDVS